MSDELSIAMQMPDDSVEKAGRKQPTSLTSQIAALNIAEVASKVVMVDKDYLSSLTKIKKGLSDGAYSSVRSAKNRNGMADTDFCVETAHVITSNGHIYAMAIITRVK